MKNYLIVAVLLAILLIICNCSNQKDKNTLDFNDYSFDTILYGEGLFNIGYEFNINGKFYANKKYNFIYKPKNILEKKILMPNSFSNYNFAKFPIYWRETILPFRIIKGINSDTLIIVKGGREFVFKRVKNTNL